MLPVATGDRLDSELRIATRPPGAHDDRCLRPVWIGRCMGDVLCGVSGPAISVSSDIPKSKPSETQRTPRQNTVPPFPRAPFQTAGSGLLFPGERGMSQSVR